MHRWTKALKGVKRYYGDLGIAWKFTLAYFIILALPVILTGLYISVTTTNSIHHQAELLVKQSLLQKREMIHQKIQSIERTSIAIAQNPQILKYLNDTFENNRQGYENYINVFAPLFDSYIIQNKYIHHTRLYVSNTSFPDAWNRIYHMNRITEDERYRSFLEKHAELQQWNPINDSKIESYISTAIKERVFSLSRKLVSFNDGRCIGLIEIEIAAKTLFDSLEKDSGVVEYYLIFDGQGNIVSENGFKTQPVYLKPDFIDSLARNEDMSGVIGKKNEQVIVWSLPLDHIGCRLVGIAPMSVFMVNNPHYRAMIAYVIITALFVFGLLIHFVSNQLTRRLKLLVIGMKSVRDEHTDVKMQVGSHDEVGELTESFNRMTDRIHDLIERVYKAQIMEKESALKALEAQINPHFLYNTLSTLSWMAREINADNIDHLAFMISKFYRLVLSKGNSVITAGDEIELLKAYVEIEKIRFDGLFQVVYDLDEKAFQYKTIKIILQPIAENAIHHGIAPKDSRGTMVVRLRQDDEYLYFTIIDDGVGISREILTSIDKGEIIKRRETGYAIQNVRDRIQAVYGTKGRITIFSRPGIGCTVSIVLPKN